MQIPTRTLLLASREELELLEVDGLVAGAAAAGPTAQHGLQEQHRLRQRQAGRGAFGSSRSRVRKACAQVTSARDILAAAPAAKILVLSMQDDSAYVQEAFAAGVGGYLLKDAADIDLLTAVREVAAGRRYLHPALGAQFASPDTSRTGLPPDSLSGREREVLRLLALRVCEPGDRQAALHLGPHRRDAPRARHAKARARHARRPRPPRTPRRPARPDRAAE